MHRLDDGFRKAKEAAARKRRRARIRTWSLRGSALLVLGLMVWGGFNLELLKQWAGLVVTNTPEPGLEADIAPDVYVPAIVDLAGDPLIISLGDGVARAAATHDKPMPDGIAPARASGEVTLLSDTMVAASERFMTTLPSSPEDFAFYQAQRFVPAAAPAQTTPIETAVPVAPVNAAEGDDYAEAGWGETISGTEEALPDFAPDVVENTTTVLAVADEGARFVPSQDVVLRILVKRDLKSLLPETPFAADALEQFDAAMKTLLGKESLEPGDVVGLRGWRHSSSDQTIELMQVSIKAGGNYLGTLSRSDAGGIVLGADPWINSDFLAPVDSQDVLQPGRQYRLLDAIYSTAVRNGVPTSVLGETIKLMSRAFDLNAFASTEDKLVLAYAENGGGDAQGRVLYAAIRGTGRDFECYVFRNDPSQDFSCFTENSKGQVVAVPSGMVTPVPGVLTSTFGPRMHPIFHETRVHTGVDWAAPTGTPVLAAFAGVIASAGDGGGYGNLLRITHPGGRETRYAHLKAFAEGMVPGRKVAAGEVVGYVGTTGNSTGPHLHFELRVAGVPVDPLAAEVDRAEAFVSDGSAVDELTERIVAVESGGNASARNPLSSATGAGQFISSTWVRMMHTYRPDLANAMDQTALLQLRNDPTISREMVRNLAREGEAYLKARGHGVTAGRLYLCHFLGMEDAHRVLSADGASPLAQVLAPGVISANPFLTGKDVNYVIAWAEGKMGGKAPRPSSSAAPAVQAVAPSAEFAAYKSVITALIAAPVALPAAAPAGDQAQATAD